MDKLGLCSDVRGDRHAIEAQLHKVEVRHEAVELMHIDMVELNSMANSFLILSDFPGLEIKFSKT